MANIKISKVARDLNIGLPTVIEFLQSKGISVKMNPNSQIDEAAHKMLLQAYGADKDVKKESEKLSSERQKEKTKPAAPASAENVTPVTTVPRHTIVGKIDLDARGNVVRKPVVKQDPVAEQKTEKPAELEKEKEAKTQNKAEQEVKKEVPAPKVEEKIMAETKPEPELKPEVKAPQKPVMAQNHAPEAKPVAIPAAQAKEQSKPVVEPRIEKTEQKPEAEKKVAPVSKEPEIFTTGPVTGGPQLNVIGKIDLSAINQQTRPKKKTKEERRNERIAKDRAQNGAAAQGADRKKRRRIGKEKVDIEKTSNQQPVAGGAGNRQNANPSERPSQPSRRDRKKDKPSKHAPVAPQASEEDVQRQVKETLARLINKDKGQKKGAKWRKEKREAFHSREREAAEAEQAESQILKLTEFVTANDLAMMMDVPINQVIATCMNLGVMVSINQRLDAETINIVAEEFGFKTEYVSAEVVEAIHQEEDSEEDLENRPPIVTVMGHVDHGKTSLLDYIRNANVIAGEAGGITQHIGAYNVKLSDGRRITFLDTPGHEAFTAMRARGAKVTDLCIIIVAADDNVMPQTVEAINHASAAGVPMVFAINKIDKPTANPDKIKEELAAMNYLVEDWGGKYQSQDISAKKGLGVDDLMEKVLLEAEMLDLKANPNRPATGSIIESSLDKGRGYVATVLVQNGTLRVGDVLLAGTHHGRIKAMFNERNQRIKEAGPSTPVLVLGLDGAPTAGDIFNVMETEQEAREIASKREQLQRELGLRTNKRTTLEEIGRRRAIGNFHELNIIVKGDVDGSIEALSDSLIKLSTDEIKINVLHKAVGAISESDVTLAAASDAIIIGFQVRPSQAARRAAEHEGVEIRLYSVIYQAIEEVKDAMEGMLEPELKEEVTGTAEVLQTYKISKIGTIAGAIVREGKIKRACKVRLIRDGIVRYTGELGSLKRFKDDVKEVLNGYDCGISIAGYNDLQEGDYIEAFEEVEVKKTL